MHFVLRVVLCWLKTAVLITTLPTTNNPPSRTLWAPSALAPDVPTQINHLLHELYIYQFMEMHDCQLKLQQSLTFF